MANTFRKVYRKTGNSGSAADYQLVGNIGVNGVELDIMKGATSSVDGEIGLVPKPTKGQENYVLGGNGKFNKISDVLDTENYGKYIEITGGTGCYVRYNEINVCITLNARGVFTHDTRTKLIVLPEGIVSCSSLSFILTPIMNQNWVPNGNLAYIDFGNVWEATTKYRNPSIRLYTPSSLTLQIVGTYMFPRSFFMIGDEIEGTPTIG